MTDSWKQWKRKAEATERKKQQRPGIGIEISIGPMSIGCKWQPCFDDRYEICVYHQETRRAASRTKAD